MSTALEVLTASESQALEAYESEIAPNVKAFIRVGKALMAIRDSRLYRTQFKSFEAYCAERWDISRTRAHQMIDAAHVCKNFEGLDVCPENEGQVRVLAKLPPEKQVEVFTRVAASGNVTAKKLEEALGGNICEQAPKSEPEAEPELQFEAIHETFVAIAKKLPPLPFEFQVALPGARTGKLVPVKLELRFQTAEEATGYFRCLHDIRAISDVQFNDLKSEIPKACAIRCETARQRAEQVKEAA